jgi:arabinogalactan oligomer/maltooligosaccharide transport system substrate-binding protein
VQAVALYYNRSLVSAPPTTTNALLDLVKQGQGLDIPDSPAYFAYGFWSAFGGQLMDENGRCIADQGGFDLAAQYLLDLQDAGANVRAEYGEAGDRFRSGETAMVINGPWALTDYRDALGENLGVVLLPSGPAGPARPLAGVSAFFVNAHSHNTENAVKLALYLTSQDSAQIFTDQASHVPVRDDVSISDSKIVTFSLAGTLGAPFPPNAQMSGYWGPFGDLFNDVLDGGMPPDEAVLRACEAMNEANGMP